MISSEPTATELFELDLDTRLGFLWTHAWGIPEWDEGILAPFLRFAYYLGYREALTERWRGQLFRDHGQSVPIRQQSERS